MLTSCNALLGIEDRPARDAGVEASTTRPAEGTTDAGVDAEPSDAPSSSLYVTTVLADGPLLYLRLGEAGGQTAHDTMKRFDGTYSSVGMRFAVPGAIVGDSDGAAYFEETGSIHMPAGADFVGRVPFTVEVWMKPAATIQGLGFVIDHETWVGGIANRAGWNILLDDTALTFERYGSGGNASRSAPPITTDTWHHVAATWDGNSSRLFVDGELSGDGATSSIDIPAIPEGWSVAAQNCECSGNHYVGALDELAIYDKVLGQDRLRAHVRAAGR